MSVSRWWVGPCCLAVVIAGAAGCGGSAEPKKYPVQGTVKLDAKPLESGTIYFKTVATGAVDSIDIHNGEYQGEAGEGERRVEVVSYRTKVVGTGQMKGGVQESLVPAKYNTESKLTATVTAAGPNKFPFELTSK